MDTQLAPMLRQIRASGQTVDIVCDLLEDLRLSGLQKVANHTATLIRGWRTKQVKRALEMSEEELMQFIFIAIHPQHDYRLKPTKVVKRKDHIVFYCQFKVKHEMSYEGVSLVNDLNYNFGRESHPTHGDYLEPGHQFHETFTLRSFD